MTDAPKIDTQAPRIGMTVGVDFATGKDTTMLTLTMGDKFEFASANSLWGRAMLDLLAERDLADARAAAAAQAMREAAQPFTQVVELADAGEIEGLHCSDSFGIWLHGDDDEPVWCVNTVTFEQIGKLHYALPDPTALDRLIAERVREAVREIKEAWDWWQADSYDRCASVVSNAIDEAMNAARGSKEGRDG